MTEEHKTPIDQWYRHDYAHGVMAVAQRGETAIKAADLDDNGTLFPILIREEELSDMERVEADDVPDRLREYLEEQHNIRSKNINAVRGISNE